MVYTDAFYLRHLELLKMASTSRFREVCEEDVQNVLQSAIPEKNKESYKVVKER